MILPKFAVASSPDHKRVVPFLCVSSVSPVVTFSRF